jgi:hypothetical protein
MARRSFHHYVDFIGSVVRFWSQCGPDFTVGEWNSVSVAAEKEKFRALNDQIGAVEMELNSLRIQRDLKCLQLENLDRRLRSGVLGAFGAESSQLENVPHLFKAGVGRPNKSAETRKRNTVERKKAEKLAREEALRAEGRAELAALTVP